MSNNQQVALSLVKLREDNGLSQAQLSEILGVSTSTVSLWEAGLRSPNKRASQRICQYFDCDLNFLFGLSESKKSTIESFENVRQIAYYDRDKLVDNIQLNEKDKYVFDITNSINTLSLPRDLFIDNVGYFAIKITETNLINYGLGLEDIAIFKNANNDEIDSNKVVCALIDNKIVVRVFVNVDRNTYMLKDLFNENNNILMNRTDDECIIGVLRLAISMK